MCSSCNCTYGYGHGVSHWQPYPLSGGISNPTVINCTFNNTEAGILTAPDRDRGGYLHNLSYLNLSMTNVACPIRFALIHGDQPGVSCVER